jgi:hypothetical protein
VSNCDESGIKEVSILALTVIIKLLSWVEKRVDERM